MEIILTVGDHEQNGLVGLARWLGLSEAEARRIIADIDAQVPPDAEPDLKAAPFTFILDLMNGPNEMLDNSERCLPTQVAMRIARDPVSRWLAERPVPDDVMHRAVPIMPISVFG